jgi:hypothetical protein
MLFTDDPLTLRELELHDRAIFASEDWAKGYDKRSNSFKKLIHAEARLARLVRGYFRDLSTRADEIVNWEEYYRLKAAVTVDVTINDHVLADEDTTFMKIIFDEVAELVAVGTYAGEETYSLKLGAASYDSAIQQITKQHVADLVGKKVVNGVLVDNPKSTYAISNKTREDIRQAIGTSISLGEDRTATVERLRSTINNKARATLIAETESVNAYQKGILYYGDSTGAVAKEWQDIGAKDICSTNSAAGVTPINGEFPSGHLSPTAHPRCRCGMRLIYPEELN